MSKDEIRDYIEENLNREVEIAAAKECAECGVQIEFHELEEGCYQVFESLDPEEPEEIYVFCGEDCKNDWLLSYF